MDQVVKIMNKESEYVFTRLHRNKPSQKKSGARVGLTEAEISGLY